MSCVLLVALQPQVIEGKAQIWDLPKWLGIEAESVRFFFRDRTLFPLAPLLHKVRRKKGEERGWLQPTMAGVGMHHSVSR